MFRIRAILAILFFISLAACGGGGGAPAPANQESNSNNAAKLNSIDDITVTPGNDVNFTITASNSAGHNITFSADLTDTVYSKNATFNPGTQRFSWMTSIIDEGVYQVTFTVTDNDVVPVESDSVVMSISLLNPSIAEGKTLYEQNCLRCHGTGGVGGSQTLVLGSSPLYVRTALGLEQGVPAASQMGSIAATLADPVANAASIGYYLCDLAGIEINDIVLCEP